MKQDVARQISRLANMVKRKMNEFSSFDDLTFSQSRVLLFLLRNSEGVFQKDIEDEYMLRPPTATALLKSMEQAGLLQRQPTEDDGRKKKIILTDKAVSHKEKAEQGILALETLLTKDIVPEELEIFIHITEQMIKNLNQEELKK